MPKLNERRRKFVLYYEGNATEAAIKAGYSKKTAYSQGQRLLKNAEVQAAIKAKQAPKENRHILSIEQRKELLCEIASEGGSDRTKALDILNKMEAVYIQKQEVTHSFGSQEEIIKTAIEELESLGYKVIPPNE